jgi:hypothetical protein
VLVYWLLFLYFAAGAVGEQARAEVSRNQADLLFRFGCFATALLVGLRFQVGADWTNYDFIFNDAKHESLGSLPAIADPGYYLVNIVVQSFGGPLWIVNLVCALLFSWGLMRFCEAQERPWLAALVAVPYLIIVVAMGYTRQAVAIGLIMAGLASYFRTGSVIRFAAYTLFAATFHKTAVVALPLIAIANERGRIVSLVIIAAITYVLYHLFLAESVNRFVTNYIDTRYAAEGAAVRVAMNLVPAGLFLLRSRRMGFSERERRVWRNTSFAALAFFAVLLVSPSSAAVDRLALYVIPIQLAVLSRPRGVMVSEGLGTAVIIFYTAAIQFTWLNYAHHARYWVPYHFWPLGG